jgi:hypothetical protein
VSLSGIGFPKWDGRVNPAVGSNLTRLTDREGFEPEAVAKRINKLLSRFEFLSPPLPSDPRIWHSIWH